MSNQKLYPRNIITALAILLAITFFTWSGSSVVSAQAATKPIAVSPSIINSLLPEASSNLLASGCSPTGGSGGLAPGRHETTVAGLNAVVVVGKGYKPGTTTYLSFLLHGDGGDYKAFLNSTNAITQFVDGHNWIFVAAQSPNGGAAWWTNMNGDHVAKFAKVLDAMFAKYNVCRNVVFGSAGSGGSEFWTSQFFPNKGGTYPAHTVIACGGNDGNSDARQKIKALGQNSTVVSRARFYYVYGTKDKLVPGILESISAYQNAGFKVYVDKLDGAGHCNEWKNQGLPGWHQQIATKWGILIDKVGAN